MWTSEICCEKREGHVFMINNFKFLKPVSKFLNKLCINIEVTWIDK